MPGVSFVVSLRRFRFCPFISSSARGTHGAVTRNVGPSRCDLFTPQQQVPRDIWKKKALTADLHALIKAILAVVLPVTQPLLGDALVLRAGKLVPQA